MALCLKGNINKRKGGASGDTGLRLFILFRSVALRLRIAIAEQHVAVTAEQFALHR